MVTVVMECENQERALALSLAALVPAAVEGLVREVIVVDRGSIDGSPSVAEAAGCVFVTDGDIEAALSRARSEWLFLMEAGARPLAGWTECVEDHITEAGGPARLSPARGGRGFLGGLLRSGSPLRGGLLLPKHQALARLGGRTSLSGLGRGLRCRRLAGRMVPPETR